ncbi:lytic murein transglycosylase [Vibrio albus]|uniref:Lytic murein transglycosylase n=1 Tax=Vibrio albus TaxID=2200953 RepID=A0A2U3B5S0_9VIBR|nr:transglycosylase SLT domain-containing protein [Vibrio albus]PWI32064.1 lytic murein transglycosylase [Vibrio albus]
MQKLIKLVSAVLPFVAISSGANAAPASLAQQRVIYQQAQSYLDKKQVDEYLEIRDKIADYPLTPYVDYRTFLIDIGKRTPEEVEQFTRLHQSFPFINNVRAAYLDALIKQGNWTRFYQYQTYEPKTEKYRCSYYYAQYKNGQTDKAFEGAEKLWLNGHSVSDHCDPLFEAWDQAGLRTDDLILRRMLLTFDSRSYSLLSYLAKMTQSEKSKLKANSLKYMSAHPDYVEVFAQTNPPSAFNRKQSAIALKRLARKDINKARSLLDTVFIAQEFSDTHAQKVLEYLASRLISTDDSELAEWRDSVLEKSHASSVLERRIRLAIRLGDWPATQRWIQHLPADKKKTLRWQYWLGRAELVLGKREQGIQRLQAILGQRNFYSVAAAKSLDKPVIYQVQKTSTDTRILDPYKDSLIRIKEMIELDKIYAAKREWSWLLWMVGKSEKKALAVYAAERGWHHLTVTATIEAKMWDDTALRFPVAHRWWFNFYGDKHKVDPITLMSVARQESALDAQARSPVGARGIMQIMPRTAKYTAKKYKLNYRGASDLYDVGKNIEIGSRYLNSLLSQYDNNRILALAAYNAGPHRVKKWREISGNKLDAFAFIETIPFKETRRYVQNILMFETYYRELMGVDGSFLHAKELSSRY